MNRYLSTISRLRVISMISVGTLNKLRSPKHITHNTNRHRTLSVRTLRVRELCRHDRDTSPVNNQYGCSYWFLHILRRSLSVKPHNNIRCSLCHRYVTCRRFEHRYHYTSSISLPASLFTHSIMHHTVTNSLVTLLARLIVMCITERAQRYLSETRSDKS